eukprot:Sspe_Gene.80871::Locus_51326_Transcript_1_1_Confidence_1.000_Length_853::g.80871::m.80871
MPSTGRTCLMWQQGKCRYGTACRYPHSTTNNDREREGGGAHATPVRNSDGTSAARKECRYFAEGECRYGSSCRDLHVSTSRSSTSSTPQRPCSNWSDTGRCRYGSSCRYQHVGSTPARSSPSSSFASPSSPSNTVCRNLENNGRCPFGASCYYLHPSPPTSPRPTRTCKTWAATGSCRYGTACRDGHPEKEAPPPPPPAAEETNLCVVCLTTRKEYMIQPCNHVCLCEQCSGSRQLTSCPLCRGPVRSKVKVYL